MKPIEHLLEEHRLLDVHFEKEEQILFPMALQLLDAAALEEVARKMEAIA